MSPEPQSNPPPQPVALLAGGQSRRFGSDKARALVAGQPLLLRNLRTLTRGGHQAFVVGPPRDTYADLGVLSVPDDHPGEGPLAGLITALKHRRNRWGEGPLGVAACDFVLPRSLNLPGLFASLLARDGRPPGLLARIATVDDRLNPVLGAYHTQALPRLETAYSAGERSLTRWLQNLPCESFETVTPINPPPGFNTPDELQRATDLALAFDATQHQDSAGDEGDRIVPPDP